ncbi:MAG: hypothetical protein FJ293_13090 [Planctomycetes bacterium]|nr:hypothetical protein [Planctomycetota bacterium]
MGLTTFALVLLSAALHVAWNSLARSQRHEPLSAWLLASAGVVVLLPPFAWSACAGTAAVAPEVVGYAALSGVIETVAFLALTAGYRESDLSLVYPLSRGLAPVVAAAVGVVAASERIGLRAAAAIGVVLAGAVWLAATATRALDGAARWRGVKWSLLSACAVAGYHLSDRAALRHPSAPDTWTYFLLMQLFLVLFMSAWLMARRVLTRVALARVAPLLPRMLLGGLLMQGGYWLVLLALKQGASSLVVATRNLGIPLSLLVGALWFREPVDRPRWLAATVLTAGILLLAT